MNRRHWILSSAIVGLMSIIPAGAAPTPTAAPAAATINGNSPAAQGEAVVIKGLAYLKNSQKPDGGWQETTEPPAITAIVLKAFLDGPKQSSDPQMLDRGFKKLLQSQQPDGSIASDVLATYNTAIAVSTFAADPDKYKEPEEKALRYLESIQWTDKIQGVKDRSKQVPQRDPNYGGWGYGGHGRADMSNTQMALDALHDAGLKSSDPAYQAAIKFITRDQNHSETNDQPWAGDDGGFIYTPAQGGSSVAGTLVTPDGKKIFRSYGSMTYAGLKSMIYAGLSKDDPRVKAAWQWVRDNWTLDQNPGMQFASATPNTEAAQWGLYYYYHTLARALRAYGEPIIVDSHGNKHDWRVELIQKIASEQHPDGSWVGRQRFMEDKPILSGAYAILAMEEALADLKDHPAQK